MILRFSSYLVNPSKLLIFLSNDHSELPYHRLKISYLIWISLSTRHFTSSSYLGRLSLYIYIVGYGALSDPFMLHQASQPLVSSSHTALNILSLLCALRWLNRLLWLAHHYTSSTVLVILVIFWFSWQWPTGFMSFSSISYNCNYVIVSVLHTMALFLVCP
jgi:hypothetical protein